MNPLDQLNPLHLPPPPDWWPPAPGWWLLLALVLSALGVLGVQLAKRHRARAYRREALALSADCCQARDFGTLLNLIRRTAKTTAPESHWPSLDAPALLQRLDQWSDGQFRRELLGNESDDLIALANRYYRQQAVSLNDNQWQTLTTWTQRWIRRHQPQDLLGEAPSC